jgi:hypothetical protein
MSRLENIALYMLIAVLCLAVLAAGCGVLEAMDESGCRDDCRQAGIEFSRYEFERNHCWGLLPSGEERQLY